jgi:hypothetical protein
MARRKPSSIVSPWLGASKNIMVAGKTSVTQTQGLVRGSNSDIPNFDKLNPVFADRLNRMVKENPSIVVSETIRSEENVKKLFNTRYEKTDPNVNVFNSKTYDTFKQGKLKEYKGDIYKLKPGNAPAAVPGASYHTAGLAADLSGNVNLASKVSKKYGLENIMSIGEPWHFQPTGLPQGQRVVDFVKKRYNKDIVANPLKPEALKYINEEFASNAPEHPDSVLFKLNTILGKPVNPGYGRVVGLQTEDARFSRIENKQTKKIKRR